MDEENAAAAVNRQKQRAESANAGRVRANDFVEPPRHVQASWDIVQNPDAADGEFRRTETMVISK